MDKQEEALEFLVKTLKNYDRGLMLMKEVGWDVLFKGQELESDLLVNLGHVIILGINAVGEEA